MATANPLASRLAGVDWRDAVSARHPKLQRAAVLAALAPAALLRGMPADADRARLERTAALTPSGNPQPPELDQYDGSATSARVPNALQPESGEITAGAEARGGQPAFFGPAMPPPTGTTNNVGVPAGNIVAHGARGLAAARRAMTALRPSIARGFGRLGAAAATAPAMLSLAPTAGERGFIGQPSITQMAALPHFAAGGTLAPGAAGVVGEQGEELIQALPGGGVRVIPAAEYARKARTAALAIGAGDPYAPGSAVRAQLAALPHFAAGGLLPAGATGVAGEDGPEAIDALPAMGARVIPAVTPAAGATTPAAAELPDHRAAQLAFLAAIEPAAPEHAADALAALPPAPPGGYRRLRAAPAPAPPTAPKDAAPTSAPADIDAGLQPNPDLTPRQARELGTYADVDGAPLDHRAADALDAFARQVAAEHEPNAHDPQYHVPVWKRALAIGAAGLVGATQYRPEDAERVGAEAAEAFMPDPYARAEQQFAEHRAEEKQDLGGFLDAANEEAKQNTAAAAAAKAFNVHQDAERRSDQAADLAQAKQEASDALDAGKTVAGRRAVLAANPDLAQSLTAAERSRYLLTGTLPAARSATAVAAKDDPIADIVGAVPAGNTYDRKTYATHDAAVAARARAYEATKASFAPHRTNDGSYGSAINLPPTSANAAPDLPGAVSAGVPAHRDASYLAEVDAANPGKGMGALIRSIDEGRMPFPTSFAQERPYWQSVIEAVGNYDPGFDAAVWQSRVRTRQDFTSGKAAQQVNALNTAIGHLSQLEHAAAALHNGGWRTGNAIANWLKTETGKSAVTNFETVVQPVADELTRVWRGTGGSEADIASRLKALSPSNSPQQLRQAIAQLGELMASKIGALQTQYEQGMGMHGVNMLTPESAQVLQQLERPGANPRKGDTQTHAGWRYQFDGKQWVRSGKAR